MGKPMARNLLKAGHSLVVYDILPDLVSELVAAGASRGNDCADAAARSEIIMFTLPKRTFLLGRA